MNNIKRDHRFDIMKAISILLVFFGHVMQFGFERYADNALYNIIWALQIPLFMFVSGYFTAEGEGLTVKKGLCKIGKRAVAYLVPFFSCFYIIKVLILGHFERDLLGATVTLLYSLESSLWFLWVVFILSAVFILANAISSKLKHPFANLCLLGGIALVLLLPWAALCLLVAPSFLGAKYVLYYTVFFGLGFLVKKYRPLAASLLRKKWLAETGFFLSLVIFCAIIFNTVLSKEADDLRNIVLRVVAGITGIVLVGSLCRKIPHRPDSRLQRFLLCIGANTLEIYAIHAVAVTILPKISLELFSVQGYLHLAVYSLVLGAVTFGVIALLKSHRITNFLFFGKKK